MSDALGDYVRSQRQLARLSLRQAAALARISNPYLSQIEHGLALPSVTVLNALAEALQVSAEDLLVRAAGVGPDDHVPETESAIRHDPRLDQAQKVALLAVLAAFTDSSATTHTPAPPAAAAVSTPRTSSPRRPQQKPTAPPQDGKVQHDV